MACWVKISSKQRVQNYRGKDDTVKEFPKCSTKFLKFNQEQYQINNGMILVESRVCLKEFLIKRNKKYIYILKSVSIDHYIKDNFEFGKQ